MFIFASLAESLLAVYQMLIANVGCKKMYLEAILFDNSYTEFGNIWLLTCGVFWLLAWTAEKPLEC